MCFSLKHNIQSKQNAGTNQAQDVADKWFIIYFAWKILRNCIFYTDRRIWWFNYANKHERNVCSNYCCISVLFQFHFSFMSCSFDRAFLLLIRLIVLPEPKRLVDWDYNSKSPISRRCVGVDRVVSRLHRIGLLMRFSVSVRETLALICAVLKESFAMSCPWLSCALASI